MADVEQRAEAEASAKGLTGQARKSYIGGVFNKIRQAHARVVKPGKGKTFLSNLNRRNRQLARARYQEALRPHEEAVTALKQQRKHELAQLSPEKREPTNDELTRRILASDLKPIRHISTGEGVGEAMARGVNRDQLRSIYGQHQLSRVLDQYPTSALREEAQRLSLSARGSREELIARLAAPAQPPKPPKREPAERQRQHAIADAIKHGAPDFPPGTLAAAQGKKEKRELTPIGQVDKALLDPYKPPNPHALRQLYGDDQLREALDLYSLDALKRSAEAHGVDPKASSKRVLVERLMAKAQGKPAATPPPPAAPAAMARPATKVREIPGHIPLAFAGLKPVSSARADFDLSKRDPYELRAVFGAEQLPRALDEYSAGGLEEMTHTIEDRTGKRYTGGKSKAALKAWIIQNM